VSARARGWIYVSLFLLALGIGVAVLVAVASIDVRMISFGVVALGVLGGGMIYACVEAFRFLREIVSPSAVTPGAASESEHSPDLDRSSFKPEYARRFGERASDDDAHRRQPAPGGQDGIAPDER
jgi:hypothetical protein